MQRPSNYQTKHGNSILTFLSSRKDSFVTAAQIREYLRDEHGAVSRPTVYRQLEKLVSQGKVRKFLLGGTSVLSFQYVGSGGRAPDYYRLKCEVCEGIFNIECDEVSRISRHIFEFHEFNVDDTVFYGTCKSCRRR